MNRLFMIIFFLVSWSEDSTAQSMGRSYRTALGVKVWDGAGISLKSFVTPTNALEVIGYFYRNGSRITGLYEIHGNVGGAPGLRWYVGPGAHVGFYNKRYGNRAFAGIDGVLGLDLKINKAPLNLSVDWQPSYEFGEDRGFTGNWGGVGIRYTF
ncbi:hypothetical protein EXU57_11970 [Segetibacter sp. 3557_3]|uniref:hypothetical protein n=1 Tax=Segetibacter sp. 3557_3 TaxID=2547429 RepID=UPI00105893EC|nr:hypothetical protein [Segetibacter sp. 3557_3]TDH26200.1 hypothetical protein EXU57_11970 [Segetibacter sp. 3557_3]